MDLIEKKKHQNSVSKSRWVITQSSSTIAPTWLDVCSHLLFILLSHLCDPCISVCELILGAKQKWQKMRVLSMRCANEREDRLFSHFHCCYNYLFMLPLLSVEPALLCLYSKCTLATTAFCLFSLFYVWRLWTDWRTWLVPRTMKNAWSLKGWIQTSLVRHCLVATSCSLNAIQKT